jgi:hypothetical protein
VAPPVAHEAPHIQASSSAPLAYVTDDRGLLEIADNGATTVLLPPDHATWCNADPRGRVVWLLSDRGLVAYDLRERRAHQLTHGPINADTVFVDWGNEVIGGANALYFRAAVVVDVGKQQLHSKLGCDGDQAVYCYGDDGTTLHPDLAAQLAALDHLTLADAPYLAQLAQVGGGSSRLPDPPHELKPVAPHIDAAACLAEPAACGTLTQIPGSPLWLVQTANSRGDFYHASYQLWDPATAEFLTYDSGAIVRSKQAAPTSDYDSFAGLAIAAHGGTMSIGGYVFDGTHVLFQPAGLALSCGLAGGGWRMPDLFVDQ